MTKKDLLEKLDDIESWMSNYRLSVEDAYCEVRNAASEYSYDLDDLFYDYLDRDQAEDMLRSEVESGWLSRVYFFLGDVNPMACEVFRLNGYGNLEEVGSRDIECLIDEIRDRVWDDEDDEEKVIEDVHWNVCTIK